MWNRKVLIRIVEVLLCIACVVALRVTDDESRRVFHYLRNRSREWSLLNNVTWGTIGAALATATCGGYIIITTGLLIAAATGELTGRKTELFLLGLGIILFGIVGALSLASIESIPDDLIDNAAVLGALALLTALVFIADLLMSPPRKKTPKQANAEIHIDKDSGKLKSGKGKRQTTKMTTMTTTTTTTTTPSTSTTPTVTKTTVTSEKETSLEPTKETTDPGTRDLDIARMKTVGETNGAFERTEDLLVRTIDEELPEQDRPRARRQAQDALQDERDRKFEVVERELREYRQNYENGRVLERNSRGYRDTRIRRGSRFDEEAYGDVIDERGLNNGIQDIYQRPVDEIDTPPFPIDSTHGQHRDGRINLPPRFVNPSVKIMRVERDIDDVFDDYRYSDSGQYDNVPVRMRGPSVGILKKSRDVSFNVPTPNGRSYEKSRERTRDEIEMLEEYLGSFKTTGTQTRTPSSPTDPGYVRHTASNWPQDTKTKTPGSSPEHSTSYQ